MTLCSRAACLPLIVASAGLAAGLTAGGVGAEVDGLRLTAVTAGGVPVPVTVTVTLRAPGGATAEGFTVTGRWSAAGGALRLDGEVVSSHAGDAAADLVLRVEGASLPTGDIVREPLLLPAGLLSRLPLVSLRAAGEDRLALAVPPERLAIHDFRDAGGAVELRFPFGFTRDARPELQQRAPFACVLYATDPRWHFRAALAGYYQRFPDRFRPFVREPGGWFFAAQPSEVPNPQHFAYYEGGPGGWEEAAARGMGTYPYRESSSYTISLAGDQRPKTYEEAEARLAELGRQLAPVGWTRQRSFEIVADRPHGGARCLLADSGDSGTWTGALQEVTLDPPAAEPVVVSGWSRAAGITGQPDHSYSIYVDAVRADGSFLFGQCAQFPTGDHDWVEARYVIRSDQPLVKLRVFCLLREHHGRAWFDDLRVGPEGRPAVNWLTNPGFEEAGPPVELDTIARNVVVQPNGHRAFIITDNLASDVGPPQPMNLLRFSLNVDPDLPSTAAAPSVAATEMQHYDDLFRRFPQLAGCYIDSVSAWCSGRLNARRDHWPAADLPFTYDPATRQVASHGRFAMMDFLGTLQKRYHPLGKAVFTNIHCDLASFPLYLVSDVAGIESSRFADPVSTFFYRACAGSKPVLLMNFVNLHKLDQPGVAAAQHEHAAMYGELPSTGRMVAEGYRRYGELTHHWYPAIKDLATATWEPVPLTAAGRAERFTADRAVFYTVSAEGDQPARLVVLPEVVAAWPEVAARDAVTLRPLTARRAEDGLEVELGQSDDRVRVVRLSAAEQVRPWLRARSVRHLRDAVKVRGRDEVDESLERALKELEAGHTAEAAAAVRRVADAIAAGTQDLFELSLRRELTAALEAIEAAGS